MTDFGGYQYEIYLDGLRGVTPDYPMAFEDWEAGARAALPPSVWSYVAGGAGDEHTQRADVAAFLRHRRRPARPGHPELPAAARALPAQLHRRPGVPLPAGQDARGGPGRGGAALGRGLRQSPDVGRPAVAALAHDAAADRQGPVPP